MLDAEAHADADLDVDIDDEPPSGLDLLSELETDDPDSQACMIPVSVGRQMTTTQPC